jgi:Fe-Mn family superoxide dismutase
LICLSGVPPGGSVSLLSCRLTGDKALEPHISAQIMELHHSKHHQTYITNLNAALKSQQEAIQTSDIPTQVSLQPGIKFNAGGHINHSLFWQNLCPANSSDAKSSAAPKLVEKIKATWGDETKFREAFKTALLGIQGSGWGWLVKVEGGKEDRLVIMTTKDQDPLVGKGEVPILGVDMWEHAYYLQVSVVKCFIGGCLIACLLYLLLTSCSSISTVKQLMWRISGT